MEIIKVNESSVMDELYEDNSLTLEGLSIESIPDFLNWIKELTKLVVERAYVVSGSMMNEYCHCTGNNRYNNDLTIVSVKLSDMVDCSKVIMPRFEIGGRWFNDIVDNNRRRG